MNTNRKYTTVGLLAAIIVMVGIFLEHSTPQKSAKHVQERPAVTRALSSEESRWKKYADRSNAEFHKHVVEFENDGFFSAESEASFAEMAKPRTPRYVQRGLGAVTQ